MPASEAPSRSERTRILFVPGDLLSPGRGASLLDRASFELRSAASFAQAHELSRSWSPHLIVLRTELDSHLAPEFCRAVRRVQPARAPRVLMITDQVYGAPRDAEDLACDAHLVSPVDAAQLMTTVAELLDLRERRCQRAPLDVLVHTEGFADDGAAIDATLSTGVEVSEDSMLIEANRQLGIGSCGRLLFFMPEQSERLAIEGRVRAAVDEVRLVYVVEFVDLAPQYRALIRRYVESQREAA